MYTEVMSETVGQQPQLLTTSGLQDSLSRLLGHFESADSHLGDVKDPAGK